MNTNVTATEPDSRDYTIGAIIKKNIDESALTGELLIFMGKMLTGGDPADEELCSKLKETATPFTTNFLRSLDDQLLLEFDATAKRIRKEDIYAHETLMVVNNMIGIVKCCVQLPKCTPVEKLVNEIMCRVIQQSEQIIMTYMHHSIEAHITRDLVLDSKEFYDRIHPKTQQEH